MAEPLVIRISLDASDFNSGKKAVISALDSLMPQARETGRKIGEALSSGIAEGLAKAKQLRQQLDQILNPAQRHSAEQAAEVRHQQKLSEIQQKAAQARQTIETKAAATAQQIAQSSAAKLEQIDAARNSRLAVAEQGRLKAQEAAQAKLIAQAQSSAAKLEQVQVSSVSKLAIADTRRQQAQIEANAKLEQLALANAGKLDAIAAQSGSRQSEIENRKLAQIDVLRERFALKDAERQKRLDELAAKNSGALGFLRKYSSTIREAGESVQQFGYALTGLTTVFVGLARSSVQSAIDIDKNINVLKSLTGSADSAEKRYAALIALSQKTPGLTTNLAATLDAQLRVANVTEAAINKVLPAIGKLNAVSTLGDPQKFAQNLVQLVTQNFERTDLKELVGQSPLAGEIIKSIFGVDNATNGKAIREAAQRLGITSTDAFFQAFADAAANNPKLANVTESLGTQIEKLRDRVLVALRPLGLAIIQALTPLVESAVPIIERISKAFSELPKSAQQAILIVAGLAAALGPLVIVIGGLVQAFGALGNIITVIAGAGGLTAIASAAAPVAAALAVIAAGAAALYVAWQNNFLGIREIAASVFEEVRKFATENLTYIVEFFRQNLPIFKEAIGNALNAVRAFWAENGESITKIVKETWDIVSVIISTVVKNVLDLLKILAQVVNGDLIGAFTTFAGLVKRTFDATLEVLVNFAQRAFEQFKLLGNVILDAGKNTAAAAYKLGIDIVSGLANGIKSKFGEVSSVFKEMGKGAIIAAKAQLGIQSPSKVFFEIGVNTADGYVLGLEASKSKISRAMKDVVQSGIAELPDPDKILSEIRRTQREEDTRRNFALDQIPVSSFNPSAIGAETLPKTLQGLKDIDEAIPPLTATADAIRRLGAEAVFATQTVSPMENAFSGLIDTASGLIGRGIDAIANKLGVFGGFVRSVLGSIAQTVLGGIGGALSGKGGIGGFLGNILGSVFGGNRSAGGGIGSFLTGGFSGGGGAASILGGGSSAGGGGLFGSLTSLFGGGSSAPRSLTNPLGSLGNLGGLLGGGNPGGIGVFTQDTLTGGSVLGGGGLFGNLFSGIGFGKTAGSGGALAGALPLLGVSLGASLGTDRLTSILGGAAGGLLGVGLSAAPGIIGAGGALSGLGFLAPLFSNPVTAIAAAVALPAIFLLGRARQRKRDEATSGDSLQRAVDSIKELRKAAEGGELTRIQDAESSFKQIHATFINEMLQLKTKSVRESRINNQGDITPPLHPDSLRLLFEREVLPAVTAAKARQGINDKIIPEFATGGIHQGVGLALLHHGEAILNLQQQSRLSALAGPNVLQQIGVPDASSAPSTGTPSFASGGIFSAATRAIAPPTINMTVQLVVTQDEATDILNAAASTDDGQVILVNAHRAASRNGIRTR